MENKDIRWIQRFANYKRAFLLLREALENDMELLSDLEKEGIIQRFKYTFELAWKVLKDRMENDGIVLDKISPKSVIRKAFEAKYISKPDAWLSMSGDRNLMSHTYDISKFNDVIISLKNEYVNILDELYIQLLQEINEK